MKLGQKTTFDKEKPKKIMIKFKKIENFASINGLKFNNTVKNICVYSYTLEYIGIYIHKGTIIIGTKSNNNYKKYGYPVGWAYEPYERIENLLKIKLKAKENGGYIRWAK